MPVRGAAPRRLLAGLLASGASLVGAQPQMPDHWLKPEETCPGSIDVDGYGPVEIVVTRSNTGPDKSGVVDVQDNQIVSHYNGRSYFADKCEPGKYDNKNYAPVPLLGKSLTFSVDLSELGCGCNSALYLTSMNQNPDVSRCGDYYCDANSVCGVMCAEIDIMEANKYAFHSTLHTADDRVGVTKGYGGGTDDWSGPRDWSAEEYGPGSKCIDTLLPFEVTSAFYNDSRGSLASMFITLSQADQPCNLTLNLSSYDGNTTNPAFPEGDNAGMPALAKALEAGMTPIASLWGAADMLWMDGKGKDKLGPCKEDTVDNCPNTTSIFNFSIADLTPPRPPSSSNYMWLMYTSAGVGMVALFLGAACAAGGQEKKSLLAAEAAE